LWRKIKHQKDIEESRVVEKLKGELTRSYENQRTPKSLKSIETLK
jgi:hypothetical protein